MLILGRLLFILSFPKQDLVVCMEGICQCTWTVTDCRTSADGMMFTHNRYCGSIDGMVWLNDHHSDGNSTVTASLGTELVILKRAN